jgi:hypothetical protein
MLSKFGRPIPVPEALGPGLFQIAILLLATVHRRHEYRRVGQV